MLERIITAIEKSLGSQGEIVPNYWAKDKDSGRKRQIDIAVFIKDSYRDFFCMIEVRDWKNPIGSSYVDQIIKKKDSVNADKAIIVSASGFYKPAIDKAKKYSIGTLIFEELDKVNWFEWLGCDHVTFFNHIFTNINKIDIIFNIPQEEFEQIGFNGLEFQRNDKIFIIPENNIMLSLPQVIKNCINQNPKIGETLPLDGGKVTKDLRMQITDNLYLITEQGNLPVKIITVNVDLHLEIHKSPIEPHIYRDAEKNTTIAQVITASLPESLGKGKMTITVPGDGEIGGKTISVNILKIDDKDS